MLTIRPTLGFAIELLPQQYKELCSPEVIEKNIGRQDIIAFDILYDDTVCGFAMLKRFTDEEYFLWNYAIDKKFQNQGIGKKALLLLFDQLKNDYSIKRVTTTYLFGNLHAKHVYESVGFIQTDVVDEDDVHEVNMLVLL